MMSTDGDKTTEEILNRTKLRNQEIEELLGGSPKGAKISMERDTRNTEKAGNSSSKNISSVKADPLRTLTNFSPEKASSVSRRSKFAALAADLDSFEYESPERRHKKENLLKGPAKRISMGGETRASVLFVPVTEKYSPINRGPTPYLPSNSSSFAFLEQEEDEVVKERTPESIIVEEWEESPKHSAGNSAKQMSPGSSKHEVNDRRSKFAALSAAVDEFECELIVDKKSPLVEDTIVKKPVKEEKIKRQHFPVKLIVESNNSSSYAGKPIPTSVKALRDRWEGLTAAQTPPSKPFETPKLHGSESKVSSLAEQTPCDYRPITPNHEIIGNLMDDINSDLEKYRTPKGQDASGTTDFNGGGGSDEVGLAHTISFYRRQAKRAQIPESMIDQSDCSTSKKPNVVSSKSVDVESPSYVPSDQPNNEATLKRLSEAITVQQDQICQASRALAFCRQNIAFRGSREEVDAQRALLIATERRRAILLEKDRIMKSEYPVLNQSFEPRGTLTFSYIAIKISRDFINMYVRQHSECNHYYFIVLIRHGENVLHTTLSSSGQGVKSGFVEFSHYIQLSGLTTDFVCTLEVFGLRSSPEVGANEKSKKMSTWKKMVGTPVSHNSLSSTSMTFSGSSSRPVGVMDPGFQKVGFISLNRSMLGRQKFHLVEPSYPLDGELLLNMRCFAEETESLDHRGFLSLYQLVSGLGSWTRFWCLLGNGQMRFWKYPEDEENKAPSVTLDVVKCLSEVLDVAPSVASLQHSMQVDVALGDGDVPQEEIRMLLAADTHESKLTWMREINTAIHNANIWRNSNKGK